MMPVADHNAWQYDRLKVKLQLNSFISDAGIIKRNLNKTPQTTVDFYTASA